jgi:hypothetical protein
VGEQLTEIFQPEMSVCRMSAIFPSLVVVNLTMLVQECPSNYFHQLSLRSPQFELQQESYTMCCFVWEIFQASSALCKTYWPLQVYKGIKSKKFVLAGEGTMDVD